MRVRTPAILLLPVWPLPRSLATTGGISVDVFSSPYLDVSVQAVPRVYLLIQYTLMRYCRIGFPHSEISGSKLICGSPKLIAAYHVLHRLLMPRHSPCALSCLTIVVRASYLSPLSLLTGSFAPPHSSSLHARSLRSLGHVAVLVCCIASFVTLTTIQTKEWSNSLVLFRFELCRLICFTNKIVITHFFALRLSSQAFKCFLTVAFS